MMKKIRESQPNFIAEKENLELQKQKIPDVNKREKAYNHHSSLAKMHT